jgi:hypothetical protein
MGIKKIPEIVEAKTGFFSGYVSSGIRRIEQPATDTLEVSEILGTVITNYGQTVENTQTLPSIADVISFIEENTDIEFMVRIEETGVGPFHLKAGPSDKHYFDSGTGTITALDNGDKVSFATPLVGDILMVTLVRIGASWEWLTTCTRGTATDGGA